MNRKFHMLVAVIGIALFVITSGGNSIDHKSPSEVVVAAYMAANEGKYSEVEKYMSLHTWLQMKVSIQKSKSTCHRTP
jgi:hypothetical protein